MKQKLLLFFGVFIVLSNLILAPLSAFAQNKQDEIPENERVVNKYGTVVVRKGMTIYNQHYVNKNSDGTFNIKTDIIDRDKKTYSNDFISSSYEHGVNLERAFCSDFQKYTINGGKLTDETRKADLQKGCDAIRGEKYKSVFSFGYVNNSYDFATSITILVYTGDKDLNLKHYSKNPSYGSRANMFGLEIPESEFNNFMAFGVNFYNSNCNLGDKNFCDEVESNSTINISVYKTVSSYTSMISGSKNRFFQASGSDSGIHRQVLFSSFDYLYPEDFPEDYKIKQRNLLTIKPKIFRPYPTYSVKDKKLNASIYFDNTFDFKSISQKYKATFSILDEKKEKEIFSYSFDDVYSQFNYDFSDYGTYYLKTSISIKAPFAPDSRFRVENPVYSKLIIDGGSYSFIPNSDYCIDGNCFLPSGAENCYPKFNDIFRASICELQKLMSSIKLKLGFLWLPVDIFNDYSESFKNISASRCSFDFDKVKMDMCYFEKSIPEFFVFVRLALNGSLIFAFILFLRSSLVGFLNSKGDE